MENEVVSNGFAFSFPASSSLFCGVQCFDCRLRVHFGRKICVFS